MNKKIILIFTGTLAALLVMAMCLTTCTSNNPVDPKYADNTIIKSYQPINLNATFYDSVYQITFNDTIWNLIHRDTLVPPLPDTSKVDSILKIGDYTEDLTPYLSYGLAKGLIVKDTLNKKVKLTWSLPLIGDVVSPDSVYKFYIYRGLSPTTMFKTDSVNTQSFLTKKPQIVIVLPFTHYMDINVVPLVTNDFVYYYSVSLLKTNGYEGARSALDSVVVPKK